MSGIRETKRRRPEPVIHKHHHIRRDPNNRALEQSGLLSQRSAFVVSS